MAAATVESAFILLDRASGPIRGIRSELRGLERDALAAGAAMDRVSADAQARKLTNEARGMSALRSETNQTSSALGRADTQLQRTNRSLDEHGRQVKKAEIHWSALGKAVSLVKWPAIIAGVGGATQAVGGLAAGVVGLIPQLVHAGGLGAALIPTYAGLGATMGVVKLATQDLTQAYRGNARALANLTPEGRAALQMLRSLHPEIQRLRATAQTSMLPGFGNMLSGLRSDMPAIRSIVRQIGGDVGNFGTFLGDQFGGGTVAGRANMRDLVTLADEGGRAVGDLGRAATYLAQALVSVGIAASPMTDWLGTTIVHGARALATEAKIAQETGRMGAFFDRAKHSAELLWDTGVHAFEGIRGLLHAATGQSVSLWQGIDRVATRFDDWANSVRGQTEIRRWFDDMRPVLHDTVELVAALARGFGQLTTGTQGSQMLQSLTAAVPALVQGVQTITQTLGPAVVGALANVLHLMADATVGGGPLTLFVNALGLAAHLADVLVRALGPVGPAIAAALGTYALARKMNLVDGLAAAWARVTGSATAAAEAQAAAAGGGVGGVPIVGGGGAGAMGAGEGALIGGAGAALGARAAFASRAALPGETALESGLILPRGVSAAAAGASRLGLFSRGIAAARGADVLGLASKALGVAGKFALPLMALSGVLGFVGTQGTFGQRAQGAGSALTFGIIPAPVTGAQRRTAGGQFASRLLGGLSTDSSLPAQRRTVAGLRNTIQTLPGNDALNQNAADLHTATALLQAELRRRVAILHDSQRLADEVLAAQSIRHAQALATDFASAFGLLARAHGPASAMDETVNNVLTKMRRMRPEGAAVLGDSMLDWARQQARNNPRLAGEFHKLVSGIKSDFSDLHDHVSIVNDRIFRGTQTEWKGIADAIATPVEQAREQVTRGFTAIQQQAVGSLTAMGFSHAQAVSLIRGTEQGIVRPSQIGRGALTPANLADATRKAASFHGRAMGGYVLPGAMGAGDVVRMSDGGWGAPGELVLSSPLQSDVDRDLSLAGKPPLGARLGDGRMHRARAGFVGGNFVPMPGTNFSQGQEPQIAGALMRLASFLHTTIYGISGYRSPAHSAAVGGFVDDPHTRGMAADIGVGSASRASAASLSAAMLARFGLYRPFRGPAEINHVQLLAGGARGSFAGLAPAAAAMLSLSAPRTGLGGVPGAMGDSALAGYAAGMGSALNSVIGSTTGGGGGLAPGVTGNAQTVGRAMMLAYGYGAGQWPFLRALWTQESGWNPNAVNPSSGAYGIPQALGHGHPYPLGVARPQIAWGLNYIGGRYGSPQAAWEHERRFNWYGDGADMVVNRPTIFGAGERGQERVTITPLGRGGAGSVTVRPVIESGAIVIHAGGDERKVRAIMREELSNFARAIADEVVHGRETDTASVLA